MTVNQSPHASNVVDISNMVSNGMITVGDYNTGTSLPWDTGFNPSIYPNMQIDQETIGTFVDENGEIIAITDAGQRVNISKWAKREILERIKEFFEHVVLKSNEPEKDLETLVALKILFDMYEEEVLMAKKYLELAERFTYERTFLADMDSSVYEETLDSEQGEVDALSDEGEVSEGMA